MAVAPFPADDPIWNTGGLNRTTPLIGKQALGWTTEEEPPSGYFNWFMFYVGEYIQHYKAAVIALDSGKVNLSGAAGGLPSMSGVFAPTVDNTGSIGLLTNRWSEGRFYNLTASTSLAAGAGSVKNAWTIGDALGGSLAMAAGARVNGNLISNALNDAGSDGQPWLNVVARAMRARSFRPTTKVYTQATDASLCDLVQNKSIVAVCAVSYPGGTPSEKTGGSSFNVTGIMRTTGGAGAGDITILLQRPIAANCIVLATMSDSSFTGSAKCLDAAVVAGGAAVRVRVRTVAASPSFVDEEFSVVAIGVPFNAVADTIA